MTNMLTVQHRKNTREIKKAVFTTQRNTRCQNDWRRPCDHETCCKKPRKVTRCKITGLGHASQSALKTKKAFVI